MAGIGAVLTIQCPQKREYMLVYDTEHLAGLEILESRPAHVLVRLAALILAVRKDAPLQRRTQRSGLALLNFLHFVEAFDEDQIGDLLDDLERIGEATGPEIIPDAVDLAAQFTCE